MGTGRRNGGEARGTMAKEGGSKEQPSLICRNVTVRGRRTSLRMEPYMWDSLKDICEREKLTLNQLCTEVDRRRGRSNLTASIRVFIVTYFREAMKRTNVGMREDPPKGELSTTVRDALKIAIPFGN